jgi:hypothetical protein
LYEQNVAAINLFALAAAGKVWQDSQDGGENHHEALGAQRPMEEAIGF